jgi:hypothetical protein
MKGREWKLNLSWGMPRAVAARPASGEEGFARITPGEQTAGIPRLLAHFGSSTLNPIHPSLALPLICVLRLMPACDSKKGVQGEGGDRRATGEQGPAGPAGPPGSTDAWSRTGYAGTSRAAESLGTTDDELRVIRANARLVARFDPEVIDGDGFGCGVHLVSGSAGNDVTTGVAGCSVDGGGP